MGNLTESIDVPEWVRWLAQDSDGSWWGYSVEPLRNDSGWYENEVGRYVMLGVDDAKGWEKSLTKISEKTGSESNSLKYWSQLLSEPVFCFLQDKYKFYCNVHRMYIHLSNGLGMGFEEG